MNYLVCYYALSNIFTMIFIFLFTIHRFSFKKSALFFSLAAILMTFFDALLLFADFNNQIGFLISTIIRILIMQSISLYTSKYRNSKVLFTGFFVISIIVTGYTIGTAMYMLYPNIVVLLLANIIISVSMLLFFILKIRMQYLNLLSKNIIGWGEFCVIPILFYLCFYFLTYFPRHIFYNHENLPAAITLIVIEIVFYMVIFKYIYEEIRKEEIFWKNNLFEFFLKGFRSQYENVKKSELELKILRHDMRHFVQIMNSMLEQKEYKQIKEMLVNISEITENTEMKKYCDNILINSIISKYDSMAESAKVNFISDVAVPEKLQENSIELASVLANLLENAVYSAEKVHSEERSVSLFCRYDEGRLIIEIKNDYEEEIIFDNITKLPVSSRGEGHGLGIQSVAAFVEKTESNFDCFCENNVFTVRILANI